MAEKKLKKSNKWPPRVKVCRKEAKLSFRFIAGAADSSEKLLIFSWFGKHLDRSIKLRLPHGFQTINDSERHGDFYESVSIQYFMDDGKLLLLSAWPKSPLFWVMFPAFPFVRFKSGFYYVRPGRVSELEREKLAAVVVQLFVRFVSKPLPSRYNDLS